MKTGYFDDKWNMYQGIQNVIVKLTTKESQSDSYLLINSHFDSKPGSPGGYEQCKLNKVDIKCRITRVRR